MALLGSLFIPALAETITARRMYVRVPSAWETVFLWTNGEAGEVLGSQPGAEMVREDGHYCLTIPDRITEFTLTGSNGKTTGALSATPDGDLYVTVNADGTVQTSSIGFEDTPALLSLEKREYCLVGHINNRDYGFANDHMNIGEYIFVDGSLTTTFTADSYVFVKTTDNAHWYLTKEYCTSTSGVFVENAPQKMFVPGNVEVTFTLIENADNTISLSYQTADGSVVPPTKPAVTTPEEITYRTLTIVPPTTWKDVYVYTWSPTEYGEFPGKAVEKTDDGYQISIKSTTKYLVISGDTADGRHQTGNIVLVENGKDVTVKVMVDDANVVTYDGETTPRSKATSTNKDAALSSYRVTGSTALLGDWDPNNPGGVMAVVIEGLYRVCFENVQPGTYEYKITKNGSWDGCYGDGLRNWSFIVDAVTKLTIDFRFVDGKPVPFVYGPGVVNKAKNVQQSTNLPSDTKPEVTEPDLTEPAETTTSIAETTSVNPDVTVPAGTEPIITTAPADVNTPDATAPTEPDNGIKTILSNSPFGGMRLFLFGVISACIYTVYLLIRKNSVRGDVTPEGKVLRRKRLSKADVENAVKETMPAPSDKLDQAVMETIQKAKEPPAES